MYKGHKIVALVPAYNEESKIARVIERTDQRLVDTLLVIDDGSTDATAATARGRGATVLSHDIRRGVGAALRSGMEYASGSAFDIAVIMAGGDKDDPSEIPRLLDPICDDGYDFVIGSRFLAGGRCGRNTPLHRRLATRLHPWLMSRFLGKRLTESTNGFRALKLTLLSDDRIKLHQPWMDTYGLEVYLLWKVLKLGYKHTEVSCTKVYPPGLTGYSKMTPIIGWWSILSPIFLLGFGLRR